MRQIRREQCALLLVSRRDIVIRLRDGRMQVLLRSLCCVSSVYKVRS